MENLKKNYVTIVISFVLAIAFLFLAISLVKIKKGPEHGSETNQGTNYPRGQTYSLLLTSDSSQWSIGERQNVVVSFGEVPKEFPTVYTLELLVDPEVLEIVSADSGNLWSDVNVLENSIDKANGVLKITIGQGFSAQATGSTVLTSVVLNPKKAIDATEVTLGDESQSAKAGIGFSLIAEPFVVSIY